MPHVPASVLQHNSTAREADPNGIVENSGESASDYPQTPQSPHRNMWAATLAREESSASRDAGGLNRVIADAQHSSSKHESRVFWYFIIGLS
jgi:hypothetical protein